MLVMTAIPGQTGCLAVRNVPKPTRRRAAAIQAPAQPTKKHKSVTNLSKARFYELTNGQPRFSGGSRNKEVLAEGLFGDRCYDCWRETPKNAKNKRKNQARRVTIRRHVQPKEPRQSSLMDILDELLD